MQRRECHTLPAVLTALSRAPQQVLTFIFSGDQTSRTSLLTSRSVVLTHFEWLSCHRSLLTLAVSNSLQVKQAFTAPPDTGTPTAATLSKVLAAKKSILGEKKLLIVMSVRKCSAEVPAALVQSSC